jgi:hypothetical protein
MFDASHRALKLGVLIASSIVVVAAAAAAAGALPAPLQGAAHDALGAAGINVPGRAGGKTDASAHDAVSTTEDTTSTTQNPTTTTAFDPQNVTAPEPTTTDPKGPDATGPAKFGLCTADAAGQGSTSGARSDSTAFQALAEAASSAGKTVTEFCADARPGGNSDTPDTAAASTGIGAPATAHPGSPQGHGRGPVTNRDKP